MAETTAAMTLGTSLWRGTIAKCRLTHVICGSQGRHVAVAASLDGIALINNVFATLLCSPTE